MGNLTNGLLFLTQVEDKVEKSNSFDLGRLLLAEAEARQAGMTEKGIVFTAEFPKSFFVTADQERIEQAVSVLFDNAVKYTESGGWIKATLTADNPAWAKVIIQNSGQGISESDLPHIFDRFYRPDPARAKDDGGFGLGLAIAKASIEQSGGTISAKSSEGNTEFSFVLRLSKP